MNPLKKLWRRLFPLRPTDDWTKPIPDEAWRRVVRTPDYERSPATIPTDPDPWEGRVLRHVDGGRHLCLNAVGEHVLTLGLSGLSLPTTGYRSGFHLETPEERQEAARAALEEEDRMNRQYWGSHGQPAAAEARAHVRGPTYHAANFDRLMSRYLASIGEAETDYRVVVFDAINRAITKYRNEHGGLQPGRLLLAPDAYRLITEGTDPSWYGIPVELAQTHTGEICYAVSAPRFVATEGEG